MSKYIYSVACMAIVIGIVCLIAPNGINGGLKKHIKFICSLCLICVLISPVSKIISNIDELKDEIKDLFNVNSDNENELYDNYSQIYKEFLQGKYGENIEIAVKKALFEKFKIPCENIGAVAEFRKSEENENISVPCKITVTLRGRTVFKNPREIEKFISELFRCDCQCVVEFIK